MTREIRAFNVVIPPGGTEAAPQLFSLSMPPRRVTGIEIMIPDGLRGFVGFALGSAGVKVIPYDSATFIYTNNEIIKWSLTNYIDSGSWQLFGVNKGSYTHTLQLRFLLELVQELAVPLTQMIPVSTLAG